MQEIGTAMRLSGRLWRAAASSFIQSSYSERQLQPPRCNYDPRRDHENCCHAVSAGITLKQNIYNSTQLLAATACSLLYLLATDGLADQRALLVGVGEYRNPDLNLPGIDLDLERMTDTLKIMGFEKSQIRTLLDAESTAENILHEMNTWLVDGVGENDLVVFYYSGHGSFIPDEDGDETEDGVDEVLVAHDLQVVHRNGRATLEGIVTDDEVALAIQRSATRKYLTIIDACHSGTATRNLLLKNRSLTNEEVFEKSFTYEGMPVGFDTSLARDVSLVSRSTEPNDHNFVSIAAAGDGEKAIGGFRGGFFTIGFSDAIMESAKMHRSISLFEARDAAEEFIRGRLDAERVHTPQITGNLDLARSVLRTVFSTGGNGPMWQRLEELVGEGQYFPLETSRRSYVVDDTITFLLDVKESGYLNLVTVDAEDTATVLFPNVVDDDNFVTAGRFEFPTDRSGFDFIAAPPLGPTLVLAFISQNPVSFREFGYEGRLPSGDFDPQTVFTNVTHAATRAIKLRINEPELPDAPGLPDVPDLPNAPDTGEEQQEQPWLYAASLEITVKE